MWFTIKTFLFLVVIFITSCYQPEDYEFENDKYLGNISLVPDTLFATADGKSTVNIKVLIPKEADSARRSITLITSQGLFIGVNAKSITVKADSVYKEDATKRFVDVKLQSALDTGTAKITANYLGVMAQPKQITFTRAYPDTGVIEADRFSILNNFSSEATLTATLIKSAGGKPSVGQRVRFQVLDTLGNQVGRYRNASRSSNESGKASIVYAVGLTYIGPLIIKATFAKDSENDSITVSNTLIVTKEIL